MALFTLDNNIDTNTAMINEDIKTPAFNSDIISDNILKQISGSKWYVNYYNLISTMDTNQSTADFSLDLATTEYTVIKDMVIILDTPISTDIAVNMTGSGYINAGIIPKNGDIFISKLIDGRLGVFSLTGITRKNYNLKDIFLIEFKLYTIISSKEDEVYTKILDKTVTTLIYNKDYLKTSDKQLYTEQEYVDRTNIKKYLKTLIAYYNTKVINKNSKYSICYLTKTKELMYDPNMEYFVKDIIGTANLPDKLNIFGKKDKSIFTILDMLTDKVDKLLINQYTVKLPSSKFGINPFNSTMYWCGVKYVITTDSIKKTIMDHDVTNNDLYPYVSSINYIFDDIFYNNLLGIDSTIKLTKLENIVLNMIDNNPIKLVTITDIMYDLLQSNHTLEQYYFIPIIIYSLLYYNNQITYQQAEGH